MLSLLGRDKPLFKTDIFASEQDLRRIITTSSFLILGAAGSIGQAVTLEIFKRNPKKLHCVDISENNMLKQN